MALTNLEYGSLASSSTLNQNFTYLDNKITTNTTTLQTSISSILSNIATINTRLSTLADDIEDLEDDVETDINNLKSKTKKLVDSSTMVPNWSNCTTIADLTNYIASANGYLLLIPAVDTSGNLTVNGKTVVFKVRTNADDNASELNIIPVKKGDLISTTAVISNAYFLPVSASAWEVDT